MVIFLTFGSCTQNSSAKEPIEWQVLDVNGNKALLVSRYALDCRPYHHEQEDITWENCALRKWLNEDFLETTFTPEEQERILLSEVVNDDNPEYGTRGGNNTRDRVFCLSLAEAERYLKNDAERRCRPAALAEAHGAHYLIRGNCWWWLRSPGNHQNGASCVNPGGAPNPYGTSVHYDHNAVRPALWVNLPAMWENL